MIAAVYRGAGKVIAEEWPRPAIGDSEVLLRLLGCGLCGSDIAKIVDPSTPVPLVLGHEVVGEIVALGPDVTDCAIGDRVEIGRASCRERVDVRVVAGQVRGTR